MTALDGLAVPPQFPHRLAFLGTPEVAVPALDALIAAGFDVAVVVTRPPKRRGRGSELSGSPVHLAAERHGLAVAHQVAAAVDVGVELGVVVAFGQIIKRQVLEQLAFVNLHFSLLPRWRGAAPVERALLAGDAETGVDLMGLEEGLDTGPIYGRRQVSIRPDHTLTSLRADLAKIGAELLVEHLRTGLRSPTPQHGDATIAAKIAPAELEIDWARPADELERLVRLGGAWTTFRGKRIKITAASVVDGHLEPAIVQPEGKAPMTAVAWRNGARPGPGEQFGS